MKGNFKLSRRVTCAFAAFVLTVTTVFSAGVFNNSSIIKVSAETETSTDPAKVSFTKTVTPVEGEKNKWNVTIDVSGQNKQETSAVVFVIDRSNSMEEDQKMQKTIEAASSALDTLLSNEYTQVAIVSYGTDVTASDFFNSQSKASAKAYVNSITIKENKGATNIQAGLKTAEDKLASVEADHKTIIFMTDGQPTYAYEINEIAADKNNIKSIKDNCDSFFDLIFFDHEVVVKLKDEKKYTITGIDYTNTIGKGNTSEYNDFKTLINLNQTCSHGEDCDCVVTIDNVVVNATKYEAEVAKKAGYEIYGITLGDMSKTGKDVMESVVTDKNHLIAATADNIMDAYKTIAGKLSYAAKDAVVNDTIDEVFEVVDGSISTTNGTASLNKETNQIIWNAGNVSRTAKLTYQIIIPADKLADLDEDEKVPTNETVNDVVISYTDNEGNSRTGEKAETIETVPEVEIYKDYSVTYSVPEGLTAPVDSNKYVNGDTVTLKSAPDYPGHTFKGWTVNGTKVEGSTYTMGKSDVTFVADYGINSYTVKVTLDGKEISNKPYSYNSEFVVPADETKTGYTFSGWTVNGKSYAAGSKIKVTEDLDVVGTFKANDESYTVKYIIKGTSTEVATSTKGNGKYGEEVTVNAKTITGYQLANLNETSKKITLDEGSNVVIFEYEPVNVSYTVRYLEQGTDKVLQTEKTVNTGVKFNDVVSESASPITGYTAVNTVENPSSVQKKLDVSGNVITFYYTVNSYDYVINYYKNGTTIALATQSTVSNTAFGTVIKYSDVKNDIEGYDAVVPYNEDMLTVSADASKNIINLYYEAKDVTYNVYYYVSGTTTAVPKTTAKTNVAAKYSDSITEKAVTVEGYTLKSDLSQTKTMKLNGNDFIFYYEANDETYSVEYVDVTNNNKVVKSENDGKGKFGEKVTVTAELPEGYELATGEEEEKTVVLAEGENKVTFKVTPKAVKYTVKYVEKNNETNELAKSETKDSYYGKKVTETAKTVEGYTVESSTKSIDELKLTDNVITFYYTADDTSYTVNYIEKATNKSVANSKTVDNKKYNEVVAKEEAIAITGYVAVGTTVYEDIKLGLASKNVINFYYEAADQTYTVRYVTVKDGKEVELEEADSFNAKFGDVKSASAATITGYTADKESKNVTITEKNEDNVITFYYTANPYDYVINYYINGTTITLATQRTVKNTPFGTVIKYNDVERDINGYNAVVPSSEVVLTVSEKASENVINLYYEAKDVTYNVYYYVSGTTTAVPGTTAKKNVKAVFDQVVKEEAVPVDGYTLKSQNSLTKVMALNGNDFIFYYEANDETYSVEYVDVTNNNKVVKSENGAKGKFGDEITVTAELPTGYELASGEQDQKTVVLAEGENKVTFKVSPKAVKYTVKYVEKNNETNELAKSETKDSYYGKKVTETAKTVEGYTVESSTKSIDELKLTDNVITFYYTADDTSYTVNYLEKSTNNKLAQSKTVDNKKYNEVVAKEEAILITGYVAVGTTVYEDIKLGLASKNVINFYYEAADQTYTVRYVTVKDGKEVELKEADSFNAKFNETKVADAAVIPGYSADKEQKYITVKENNEDNVITFYYTADSFDYVVNYYKNGTTESLINSKIKSAVFGTKITEKAEVIEGYNALSDEESITITVEELKNVVNFYYSLKTYKVTYMVNGEVYGTPETVDYGTLVSTLLAKSYTTPDGFTFSGWSTAYAKANVEADIVIVGTTTEVAADEEIVTKPEVTEPGTEPTTEADTVPDAVPEVAADEEVVQTGDSSNMMLYIVLMLLALAGTVSSVVVKKTKER